ncbi:MAG: helix-turn-helix domain-containing protein [Caldilineaceae bacterium]
MTNSSSSSFGTWVQQQRKALDLTQAELAEKIGCAPITVKKIEQDRRRPSRQLAHLLAQKLQIVESEQARFVAAARGVLDRAVPPPTTSKANPPTYQCFVGREQQLSLLDGKVTRMLAGEAQVGFITGEAGRGKSSLLTEFARRVDSAHAHVTIVGGSCNAFAGTGDPYLPFRDIFNALMGEADTHWSQAISTQQTKQLQQQLPYTVQLPMEHSPDLLNVLYFQQSPVSTSHRFRSKPTSPSSASGGKDKKTSASRFWCATTTNF